MSDTSAFGTLIREQRLEKGLSLGQLATQVGHTAASVRRWERGEDTPSPALVTRLAEVLELEPERLSAALTAPAAAEATPPPASDSATPVAAPPLPWEVESEESETTGPRASETPGAPEQAAAAPEPSPAVVQPVGADPEPPAKPAAASQPEPPEPGPGHPTEAQPQPRPAPVPAAPAPTPQPEVAAPIPAGVAADAGAPIRPPVDRPSDITEAPTEAVPVVPAAPPVPRRPAASATPTRPPALERPSFQNPFRVMFDPNRRWLYWIRLALLITASLMLLFVFIWAMGELWDSLGELLDTIGSTESVTDGNGVELDS